MKRCNDEGNLRKRLEKEIEEWQEKLNKKLGKVSASKEEGYKFIKNIEAYYKDSKHFYNEEKLIESFEALIWAWSWIEIGIEYDFLKES